MGFSALRWACAGLTGLVVCAGFSTFGSEWDDDDNAGPERWSDQWYAPKADEPVSARQKWRFGKLWPPYPRPVGDDPECSHVLHANVYWPLPYVCYDRAYVRTISNLQVANGWTAEATLYDCHFDPETQCLNQAGQLHLRWIMENVPPERRCAWVQTSIDQSVSQHRLNHVREQAVAMVGESNCPPVMLRVGTTDGRPATELDTLRRSYMSTMPPPRIKYVGAGTSGNGGGQ